MSMKPLRHALTALAVVLAAAVPLTVLSAPAEAKFSAGIYKVTGHRGFPSVSTTENTIKSLKRAKKNGAKAVEVDISLTRDRGYVIMHDATLDRTTTCSGSVDRKTLAEIQQNCRGQEGDEYIPSLATVLNWAKGKGINLILEIKHHPNQSWAPSDFLNIDAAVRSNGLGNRVIYHGEVDWDLKMLKGAVPSAHVQAIAESWAEAKEQRKWADGLNVDADVLTSARVRGLHQRGLLVLGRMTNSKDDWARLRKVGVDGLLTDDTKGYTNWVHSH